ncbi:MAG: GDP-mannose 4,6-dehydratase [Dongiaceae bacterium]
MKALVTGAGGFIGSHLCEALRDAGHDVTGLAHYSSRDTFGWLDEVEGIKRLRGDVRDAEFMIRAAYGAYWVFHLAALGSVPYSYEAPRSVFETNAIGTLNVALACVNAEAKLILASTSEVYGTPERLPLDETHPRRGQSPYAASKIAAEEIVRSLHLSRDLNATILRPFNTYGPRQSERAIVPSLIRQALDPDIPDILIGKPDSRRDLMYVTDTARAFIAAAWCDQFGPFNAATGEDHEIMTLAEQIRGACGIVPTREPKSITTKDWRLRPDASDIPILRGDAGAFQSAANWQPKIGLNRGLARTIVWRMKQPFGPWHGYLT